MPLLRKTLGNVGAILAGLMTFAPEVFYWTETRPELQTTTAVAIGRDQTANQPGRLDEYGERWAAIGTVTSWSSPPKDMISTMSAPLKTPENPMAFATEEDLIQYRQDRIGTSSAADLGEAKVNKSIRSICRGC
jgi:hypothetical protein